MLGIVACLTNLLLIVLVSENVSLYVPKSMSNHLGSFEGKVSSWLLLGALLPIPVVLIRACRIAIIISTCCISNVCNMYDSAVTCSVYIAMPCVWFLVRCRVKGLFFSAHVGTAHRVDAKNTCVRVCHELNQL